MTRVSISLTLLIAALAAAPAAAQEDRIASRPTIAVVGFDTSRTGWMPPPGFGETIADLLTDRLVAGSSFRIIDASLVTVPGDDPGRTPASVLMERARSVGVQFLVLGAVTQLSMEKRSSSGGGILPIPFVGGLIKKKRADSIVGLTIRMLDVRTGELITTVTAQGDASGKTSSGGGGLAIVAGVPFGGGKHSSATGIQDGLLATAVTEAVTTVAAQLSAVAPRLNRPMVGFFTPLFTYVP